jgi:nitrate reductase gamma subunit
MVKIKNWAQGILTLQPGVTGLVVNASPIFKLHLFLGMRIFLVFPFTRLVHVSSARIWYLGRSGYRIVRTKTSVSRKIATRHKFRSAALKRGGRNRASSRRNETNEVRVAGFDLPRPIAAVTHTSRALTYT